MCEISSLDLRKRSPRNKEGSGEGGGAWEEGGGGRGARGGYRVAAGRCGSGAGVERWSDGACCDGATLRWGQRGRELIVRQQEATPKQRPGCTGHSERRRGLAGPGKAWLGGGPASSRGTASTVAAGGSRGSSRWPRKRKLYSTEDGVRG
jgi:hypothetical protein